MIGGGHIGSEKVVESDEGVGLVTPIGRERERLELPQCCGYARKT
jgi:hypothetical protein